MPEKEQQFISPEKDEKDKTDEGVEKKGMSDKDKQDAREGLEKQKEWEKRDKEDWTKRLEQP